MAQKQRAICALLKAERQLRLVRLLAKSNVQIAEPGHRREVSLQRRLQRALLAACPATLIVKAGAVGWRLGRPPACAQFDDMLVLFPRHSKQHEQYLLLTAQNLATQHDSIAPIHDLHVMPLIGMS